jgi:MFS transporter, FHS family, L-fucose permease
MPIITTEKVTSSQIGDGKSYKLAFSLVTSLFFLWGLANILNSALISHFQPVFTISRPVALLIETAFYLGYFFVAIPAGLFMEKHGYKKGILLGLFLFALGTLMFIPAAELMTFSFFLLALFIIASGLAFLETGANPYVIFLGNPATAAQRINFAQSFNGLALVVGPWVAGHLIFSGNEGAMETVEAKQQAADAVILPYAMLGGIVILIAVLFYFIRMPEAPAGEKLKISGDILKKRHLIKAIVAQFFYVGAQAGIWGLTIDYVIKLIPDVSKEDASKYYFAVGTGLFVVGRVLGTWLLTFVEGSKLLTAYAIAAVTLCVTAVLTDGYIAVYSILLVNLFMSIMFPTIFALGIRNLGEYTKLGSSLIIMAIVGGAILPPLMGLFPIGSAFILPAFSFAVIAWFGWNSSKTIS